jgi:hypothetical protein
MKKLSWKRRILALALFCSGVGELSLHAQVTNFSVFKVTVHHQASAAAPSSPDTPNAYYFGAQLQTLDSSGYTNVDVTSPGIGTDYLTGLTPYYFNFGSPYYADKAAFDNDYPAGEYDFEVDYTNFSETGSVIVPGQELYATNIAAFTTDCWTAMQHVDPSLDFTLNWNSFVASSNSTSAYTFIDLFDENTGDNPFSADFMSPDTMTTNIPANTLQYGTSYRVNSFFSTRQDTPNAGFGGALGTVGFDNLTYTTLITIPPWLGISGADTNVILTWPDQATNYVLETAAQLSPGSLWTTLTNVPVAVTSTNSLTLPVMPGNQFFRLAQSGHY